MQWVFSNQNVTSSLNQPCVDYYTSTTQEYKCLFAEYLSPFIKTPLFITQSRYDSFNTQWLVGDPYINSSEIAQQILHIAEHKIANRPGNGGYIVGCPTMHCSHWHDIQVGPNLITHGFAIEIWWESNWNNQVTFFYDGGMNCSGDSGGSNSLPPTHFMSFYPTPSPFWPTFSPSEFHVTSSPTLSAPDPDEKQRFADIYWLNDSFINDGAMCMDGSIPGYYFRSGYTRNGDVGHLKMVIYFEGGGLCAGDNSTISSALPNCQDVMNSEFGSSNGYDTTLKLVDDIFELNSDNPLLRNWGAAYLPSCDGSFLGDVEAQQSTGAYYRGKRIIDAFIQDLIDNRGLSDATDVLLSGCGFGGVAVMNLADKIRNSIHSVNPNAKVGVLVDSAIYLDVNQG